MELTPLGEGYKDTCKTFRAALKNGPFTHLRYLMIKTTKQSIFLKIFPPRLNMFPDGGIARLRAYGVAVATLPESLNSLVDLSAATNGGVRIVKIKNIHLQFFIVFFIIKKF